MKNNTYIATLLMAIATLFSCNNDKETETADPGTVTTPVEGTAANTTYPPAFAGQTRASGLLTNTKYEATVITSTLTSPWGVKNAS